MCSEHFISKRKSHLPSSPDFVPSVQRKELELPVCSTPSSEVSYRCFERARSRARIQEQHCKELEKNRRAVELDQARLSDIRLAITHDHTYASSKRELVSVEEPLSEELVTHEEQDQVSLQDQELLSDEHEDENKELGEEVLGESEDAGIPVEVGKTILLMK